MGLLSARTMTRESGQAVFVSARGEDLVVLFFVIDPSQTW